MAPLQPRPATIGGLDVITAPRQPRVILSSEKENSSYSQQQQQRETKSEPREVTTSVAINRKTSITPSYKNIESKINDEIVTISKSVDEQEKQQSTTTLSSGAISKEKLLCIDLINAERNEIL